ncbi:MAG: S1 RNA-binding domain-containing protein, partial [Bacteroidales bacterium]|nr:S1 RNA-binding domain-containing protein [Bacteroidales bacterium]
MAKAGIEEFNWEELEHHKIKKEKEQQKSDDPRDEQYGNSLKQITEQQVIEGVVVSKNNREVVVNIGYKSDGIIPVSEFRYNPELK